MTRQQEFRSEKLVIIKNKKEIILLIGYFPSYDKRKETDREKGGKESRKK